MTNTEPVPGSLVQVMSPPCAAMIALAIDRPRPDPPVSGIPGAPARCPARDRAVSTRKNRSKTCGIASAGMPMPVSTTSMRAIVSIARIETVLTQKTAATAAK